jgi:hypothetical protein
VVGQQLRFWHWLLADVVIKRKTPGFESSNRLDRLACDLADLDQLGPSSFSQMTVALRVCVVGVVVHGWVVAGEGG